VLGIVINQWRQKIGVMYGDPRTTPGGVGKNYAYFVRLEVRRGDWVEVGTGKEKSRIGQTLNFRTIKNKTAPAQRTAAVDFYFDNGGDIKPGDYDFAKEIASVAIIEGIIERAGAFYKYGDQKWQGQAGLLGALREDAGLCDTITKEVMDLYASGVR
jgi:recombination protein RecA